MTQSLIIYLLVGVLAISVILSFAIGLEKMIKIILGNYILLGLCFAASISIDLFVSTLENVGFINFLINGKTTIILVLYTTLLFLVYHKSQISINISNDQIIQKSMYLIFVPLTVFSMLLTLEVIFLGSNIFTYKSLYTVAQEFSRNIYLQSFIINTPYLLFLHALITIIMTSGFKIKSNNDISDL